MSHDDSISAEDRTRILRFIASRACVCPRCARPLANLLHPVCPQCGSSLSLGVAAPPQLAQQWVWLLLSQAVKLPIGLVFVVAGIAMGFSRQWLSLLQVWYLLSTLTAILTVPLFVKLRRPIMRMPAVARWTLLLILTVESAITIGYISVYLH